MDVREKMRGMFRRPLDAIAAESGWDPGSAEHIVGTSAGSIVGALLACGVPPWLMVAHSGGEALEGLVDGNGDPVGPAGHWEGANFRLHSMRPALGPGSWRLALGALARPYRHSPATLLAGVMPDGPISTEPIREMVRRTCPAGWAPHPNYWAVAVDYGTGQRVAFGLAGPAVLSYMTWETAKIQSTQSATGILYVDFFTVIVGEVLAKYVLLSTKVPV